MTVARYAFRGAVQEEKAADVAAWENFEKRIPAILMLWLFDKGKENW